MSVTTRVDVIEFGDWALEDVVLETDGGWAEPGTLEVSAGTLRRADRVLARAVTIACREWIAGTDALACGAGRLGGVTAEGESFALSLSATVARSGGPTFELALGGAPLAAAVFEPWLAALDETLSIAAGEVAIDLHASGTADRGEAAGNITVTAATFAGRNVAEGASGSVDFAFDWRPGESRARLAAALDGGALYLEPGFAVNGNVPGFLLEVTGPAAAIRATGVVTRTADSPGVTVDELTVLHPGLLDCAGGGVFGRRHGPERSDDGAGAPGSAAGGAALRIACEAPDLAALYATYLRPMLYSTALAELDLAGAVGFDVEVSDERLVTGNFRFDDVHADDRLGRFAAAGLDGELAVNGGPVPRRSGIVWDGAEVIGIPLGPGAVDFVSSAGGLATTRVTDLAVLGGQFEIAELTISNPGREDARVAVAGRLTPVALADLCTALGLPPLGGTAEVVVPTLTYTRQSITLDSSIRAQVFDGEVRVDGLTIRDLFGVAPRLRAEVTAEGLDLSLLTDTLAFGNIEGRIDGGIEALEMAAWRPVSFDAWLRTTPGDRTRHRISRRAVDNLGQIGAGAASAVSSGWLRFIPSYSYGEIGLGCRFRNGFCWLSGLDGTDDPATGSFIMLSRGGLLPPWIEIRGTGRLIAWETLIEGFERIREGGVQVSLSD